MGAKTYEIDPIAPKIVGVPFILAAVTSIIGLKLYDPILKGPDYLVNGAAHANQVIAGALMELILVAIHGSRRRAAGTSSSSPFDAAWMAPCAQSLRQGQRK